MGVKTCKVHENLSYGRSSSSDGRATKNYFSLQAKKVPMNHQFVGHRFESCLLLNEISGKESSYMLEILSAFLQ